MASRKEKVVLILDDAGFTAGMERAARAARELNEELARLDERLGRANESRLRRLCDPEVDE